MSRVVDNGKNCMHTLQGSLHKTLSLATRRALMQFCGVSATLCSVTGPASAGLPSRKEQWIGAADLSAAASQVALPCSVDDMALGEAPFARASDSKSTPS